MGMGSSDKFDLRITFVAAGTSWNHVDYCHNVACAVPSETEISGNNILHTHYSIVIDLLRQTS